MTNNIIVYALILLVTGLFGRVFGQTPDPMKPVAMVGDVQAVAAKTITVKTASTTIEAKLTDKTEYNKVPAAHPSPKSATPSTLAEIKVGDRIIVSCLMADGSCTALRTYLMSKDDIASTREKEAEEWKTRGIAGKVTAVDPATHTVTIKLPSLMNAATVAVTPKPNAAFLHYPAESVSFADATPSSFDAIKVGDSLKAVGDKSTDGASFTAEKVLIGSFQTVAGTIKSIDAAKNEVVIKNLATGKDLTISTADVSTFKAFPADIAQRFAGAAGAPGSGQGRPANTPPTSTQGGARPAGSGAGGGMRAGGIDDMIERFPTITTADLKVGDMIAASTSRGAESVKAFKVLSGVEPFLRMAQMASGGGRRSQGVDGSFTIPGLDSLGF